MERPASLRQLIREAAGPGGTLGLEATRALASRCGRDRRQVEMEALDEGIPPERYLRNIPMFGLEGQRRLLASRAAVIGAGGLGGYIIEILARAGVGELVIADGDRFRDGNLNRQLLATEESLGLTKAEAAAARVVRINGAVKPIPHKVFLDAENSREIIAGAGVIVDALDSIDSRLILEKAAELEGIPLIHGSIGGALGQVALGRPGEEVLRRLFGEGGQDHGIETVLGTPTPIPAIIASIQAWEALRALLGLPSALEGHLLLADLAGEIYSLLPLQEQQP